MTTDVKTYTIGGGWGNAINWQAWDRRGVVGWKRHRPQVGDILLSPMESGRTGKFEFIKVDYCADPPDMFFATVKQVGYVEAGS